MARALILGGTGVIGQAVARRLLAGGWHVDVTGRRPARMPADVTASGGRFLLSERRDPAQLAAALPGGADLLVDCACYTAADASLLLPLLGDVGSTVMVSSKAVYVDAEGRSVNSDVAPRFDGPIPETQPTVAPGDGDYDTREGYGANKVAAERVLLEASHPVTVLRASKVHGAGASNPREWVFVKRVLDRRPAVLLARRGEGVDHTTAAANLAALVETVAARPGSRVLNSADPDAPSGLEIARAIARHLGHRWDEVLLGEDEDDSLGQHPWNAAHAVVLDASAATELGYVPVGDFAATVGDSVDWLVRAARGEEPDRPPAADDPFFARYFDYAAEDAYLARTRGRR